nr:hypothetical protein [Tanacetum cinerariifolium]
LSLPSGFPAASFLGALFMLLLVTANDNACYSTPKGLRRMRASLSFLRFAHSLFHYVAHDGRGWGEIEFCLVSYGFPAASFLGALFMLLLVTANDNACHSTPKGLRRM